MVYGKLLKSGFFPVCYEVDCDMFDPAPSIKESPGFKFLFDKHRSHLSLYGEVELSLVFSLLRRLIQPFLGEYVETTDSQEFLEVSAQFMQWLFWNDSIWVSYENFNSVLDECEITVPYSEAVRKVREDFIIPEKEEFQLWYRDGKDENGVWTFLHLKTGLKMLRPTWKEEFIECRWDGLGEYRFCEWFNLAYKMVIDQQNLNLLAHLGIKRMRLAFDTPSDIAIKKLIKSIYNGHPFFYDKQDETYIKDAIPPINSTEFKDYQTTIFLGWDRHLSELGRVANTNPKMERMTTGENYKDIVAVANRQRMTLNQLKLFGQKTAEKWGIELAFAINGIPQRLGMEGDPEGVDGMGTEGGGAFGSSSTGY